MLQETTFAWRKQKLQNMLHTPYMNDDYCSQCEEKKQNRNQETYMLSFDKNKKKLKTKPRKKHFYS